MVNLTPGKIRVLLLGLLIPCSTLAQDDWPNLAMPRRSQVSLVPLGTPGPILTPAPARTDCLLVATENYHRIKPSATWSNILIVRFRIDNSVEIYGHAMVVWKITPRSHVFMADSHGGADLPVTTTFIEDVLAGVQQFWNTHSHNHKTYTITEGHFVL